MRMCDHKQALFIAVVLLSASLSAHADTLANFPFTGDSTANVAGASNLTVTNIDTVNASAINYNSTDVTTTSGAPAGLATGFEESTPTSYFVVTLTPDAGYQISIDNISFFSRSGTSTRDIQVTTFADGLEQVVLTDTITPTYAFKTTSADASGINAVQVRLYGTDFAGSSFRIDDLLVEGQVRQTQLITFFNFNDISGGSTSVTKNNTVGTPTMTLVEDGSGLADPNGQGGAAYTDVEGDVHASGMSAGWTTGTLDTSSDGDDYFDLNVDTTGWEDMNLHLSVRKTQISEGGQPVTGSSELSMYWSTNGVDFNLIDTYSTGSGSFVGLDVNLGGIVAIENTPGVILRGVWLADGQMPGSIQPSVRLDNVELTGVAIPEPTTAASLLGLASLLLLRRRVRMA